jgi:hypothetical protein
MQKEAKKHYAKTETERNVNSLQGRFSGDWVSLEYRRARTSLPRDL